MNPKKAKIELQMESSNQSRGSISKFTSCCQKSDDESENEGRTDLSYQINFVDEDQHRETDSYNRRIHHSSLEPTEKLSEFTCCELARVTELIVGFKTKAFTREQVVKEIEALRVFNRFPVLSFDDFNQLKNYNQEVNKLGNLQRLQPSSNSLRIILNNCTSIVQVKLDPKLENYVIKDLVKNKEEDVYSFVSYGTGVLASWIFTAGLVDNSVQILEADSGNLIFKVTLESEESQVKSCVNIDKKLYLLLEGNIVEAYNVSPGLSADRIELPDLEKRFHRGDFPGGFHRPASSQRWRTCSQQSGNSFHRNWKRCHFHSNFRSDEERQNRGSQRQEIVPENKKERSIPRDCWNRVLFYHFIRPQGSEGNQYSLIGRVCGAGFRFVRGNERDWLAAENSEQESGQAEIRRQDGGASSYHASGLPSDRGPGHLQGRGDAELPAQAKPAAGRG
jgi:uncharacterized membrane protein